jgi:chemotaxis family two-component system response regulator Rcp1
MMAETEPFEILLAEDSPQDAELVRMALKEHGVDCTLRVIRDGAQAIAFLDSLDANRQTPALNLVIVDMNLPKRSGEDILKCLRSTEHYAQTPVIVMSGMPPGAIEERANKHAAMAYFKKPFKLAEFMQFGLIVHNVLLKQKRGAA